eukprot:9016394-Pyramimonas_sp.AAC.1
MPAAAWGGPPERPGGAQVAPRWENWETSSYCTAVDPSSATCSTRRRTVMYFTLLYCTALLCTVPYSSVLHCTPRTVLRWT